jgi:transposase InsO family protein
MERLDEAGIARSVAAKGDSYDNAMAESINRLYTAEMIHPRARWKTKEQALYCHRRDFNGRSTAMCAAPCHMRRRWAGWLSFGA